MNGASELLLLRLGLIAVIFMFIAVVALTLRGGLSRAPQPAQAARQGRWRLVVVSPGETGLRRGTEFVLAGSMVIGRDGRAGISLPDSSVSTRHAAIERAGPGWRLTDLGSTNGTLVEGRPVDGTGVIVRGRERIAFGNVVLQLDAE